VCAAEDEDGALSLDDGALSLSKGPGDGDLSLSKGPEDGALSPSTGSGVPPSKGVIVRFAQPDDAAGIARVNTISWREAYAGLLPEEFLARREVAEEVWRERMAERDSRGAVFVAQRGERIIGFAAAGPALPWMALDPSVGLLYAIYLLAEAWGTGVGHRLHQAAVANLHNVGFKSAVLWLLDGNQRAIDFYERQGWVADGEVREETMDGQVLVELRYRLPRLTPNG
jgi:L-amino acid N-acyltransferase YncA